MLALTLFGLSALLMLASMGVLVGGMNLQEARNSRGAAQVHFVAESAIAEALQVVNGPGVIHFQNDVAGQWATMFGNGTRNFPPLDGFRYRVSPVADAANPAESGQLVATATGPGGVQNIVVARVSRANLPSTSPGAIYLASDDPTNAVFRGNDFRVDGNDRTIDGDPGLAPPIPGISTRNDTNTQETIRSLTDNQRESVTGAGYLPGPPAIPSVKTSPLAPAVFQLDQMVADLLSLAGLVTNLNQQITGNAEFGNPSLPKITYFPQSVEIKANGDASGAGILIVDGDLTIKGSLEFLGLVIVRGRTQVIGDTEVTGNAKLLGSLWTNDLNLIVGGSGLVQYSTEALALANVAGGGRTLPTPIQLLSLADCSQLPEGAGGCP